MRIIEQTALTNEVSVCTIFGTSSESKPTSGLAMGSVFIEVDTGKAFLFNESTSAWVEQ
jgi:hypothetical protein